MHATIQLPHVDVSSSSHDMDVSSSSNDKECCYMRPFSSAASIKASSSLEHPCTCLPLLSPVASAAPSRTAFCADLGRAPSSPAGVACVYVCPCASTALPGSEASDGSAHVQDDVTDVQDDVTDVRRGAAAPALGAGESDSSLERSSQTSAP